MVNNNSLQLFGEDEGITDKMNKSQMNFGVFMPDS